MSQIKDKQEKQIMDLTSQINNLSNSNDGQGNLIGARHDQNVNLINEINDEQNINENLIVKLRNKENNIEANQQKLNIANEAIRCINKIFLMSIIM